MNGLLKKVLNDIQYCDSGSRGSQAGCCVVVREATGAVGLPDSTHTYANAVPARVPQLGRGVGTQPSSPIGSSGE